MYNITTTDITNIPVSPFDSSYPAVFLSQGIQCKLQQAQSIAKRIYQQVVKNMPAVSQVGKAMKNGSRFVVDIADDTKKAIHSGAIKLTQENGKTFAQLKSNGKYGKKLPIKEECFCQGIDPTQMANAMQMQAIQSQIQDMSEQLLMIDSSVHEVLQGQQNDRIALYYSGLSLFLESQNIDDLAIRSAIQAQALRALCEATFELKLTLESDIRFLKNKEYDSLRGKRKNAIQSHINSINQCFTFIHQSVLLRAGIYCEMGQLPAMASVLDEYSHFITEDITVNAPMIAQHDTNDDGTESGLWSKRAKLKLNMENIRNMLTDKTDTFYIGLPTEEEDI